MAREQSIRQLGREQREQERQRAIEVERIRSERQREEREFEQQRIKRAKEIKVYEEEQAGLQPFTFARRDDQPLTIYAGSLQEAQELERKFAKQQKLETREVPIFVRESEPSFKRMEGKPIEISGTIRGPEDLPAGYDITKEGEIIKMGGYAPPIRIREDTRYIPKEEREVSLLVVRPVEKPELKLGRPSSFLERAEYEITTARHIGGKTVKLLTGGGAVVLGTAQAIAHPFKTIKGYSQLITDPSVFSKKAGGIGRMLREEPEFATGYIATSILGPKIISKGITKIRIARAESIASQTRIEMKPVLGREIRLLPSGAKRITTRVNLFETKPFIIKGEKAIELPFTFRGEGKFERGIIGERGVGFGVARLELIKRGEIEPRRIAIYREPKLIITGEKAIAPEVSLEFFRRKPISGKEVLVKPIVMKGRLELISKEYEPPRWYQPIKELKLLERYATIESRFIMPEGIPKIVTGKALFKRTEIELRPELKIVEEAAFEKVIRREAFAEKWESFAVTEPFVAPKIKAKIRRTKPFYEVESLIKIPKSEKWKPVKGVDRYGFPKQEQIPLAPEPSISSIMKVPITDMPQFQLLGRQLLFQELKGEPARIIRPPVYLGYKEKEISMQKEMQRELTIAKESLLMREATKQREALREAVAPRQDILTRQIISPRLASKQFLQLKQAAKLYSPYPSFRFRVSSFPKSFFIPPTIPLMRMPKMKISKIISPVSIDLRYQPSLAGIYFDIKEPKIPKGKLTGLEIRGLISTRKKKGRRGMEIFL